MEVFIDLSTFPNVKDRLSGYKPGDELEFLSIAEIDCQRQKYGILYGFSKNMAKVLCGKYFVPNSERGYNFLDNNDMFAGFHGEWSIGFDMLKKKGDNLLSYMADNKEQDNKIVFPSISKNGQEDVLRKMIEMVDLDRFKELVQTGSGDCLDPEELETASRQYLEIWAKAKEPLFRLFGEKLYIETEFERDMEDDGMGELIRECGVVWPQFQLIIDSLSIAPGYFIKNEVPFSLADSVWSKFLPLKISYKMKLSKILTLIIPDKKFNDYLSKMMTTRTIKTKVRISIDPYDYLTMSLNKSDWTSCHKLANGCHANGTLSLMLDSNTMIAYKFSGCDFKYDYRGHIFQGNSKSWRQCIYIDYNTCSMIFSRHYPNEIETIEEAIREKLEEVISEYFEIPNKWVLTKETVLGYTEGSQNPYHDVNAGHRHNQVRYKGDERSPYFSVGAPYPCPRCGNHVDSEDSYFLCSECQ